MNWQRASAPAATKAAPQRWSAATIALHWLSAVLILILLGLGWLMVHGDLEASTKFDLYQLHKSLGFLGLALLALRLGARLVQASPPAPPAMPPWEHRLAGLAHVAFYLLLLAAALTGWLLVSAAIVAIPTRFLRSYRDSQSCAPRRVAFGQYGLLALCRLSPPRRAAGPAYRGGVEASFRRPQ